MLTACHRKQAAAANNFPAGWSSYTNANSITDLTFDDEGYLWAASQGGITKWNVNNGSYVRYTVADGLPTNNIRSIQSAHDDSIWIGTPEGEITRFEGQRWRIYSFPELTRAMAINDIHQDRKGNIWFATGGAGVIRFDGASWKVFLLEDGLASVAVRSISEDDEGNLWFETFLPCCDFPSENIHAKFGTQYGEKPGFSRFDGKFWRIYLEELGLTEGDFSGFVNTIGTSENGLWISPFFSKELIHYDGKRVTRYAKEAVGVPAVSHILSDTRGNTWFSMEFEQGVAKYDGANWTRYQAKDGLLSDAVRAMTVASDGTMWFGTDRGISHFDGSRWQAYQITDIQNSLPSIYIRDLTTSSEGTAWLATDKGVITSGGKEWRRLESENKPHYIYDLEIALDGSVWSRSLHDITDTISSYDGAQWLVQEYGEIAGFVDFGRDGAFWDWNFRNGEFRYHDQQSWTTYPPIGLAYPDRVILTPDHNVWVTDNSSSIFRFDGQKWDRFYPGRVLDVAMDPDGAIWVTSINNNNAGQSTIAPKRLEFYKYNGSTWELITTIEDTSWTCRKCMAFSTNGALWIGSSVSGVYRYFKDEWMHYSIRDVLSGNSVRSIYATPDGSVWFLTEGGLTRYHMP